MKPMICYTFIHPITDWEVVALATASFPMPCFIEIKPPLCIISAGDSEQQDTWWNLDPQGQARGKRYIQDAMLRYVHCLVVQLDECFVIPSPYQFPRALPIKLKGIAV